MIDFIFGKHFDNNEFRDELIRELSSNNMQSDDLARQIFYLLLFYINFYIRGYHL